MLREKVWVIPASGKAKAIHGIAFVQGLGYLMGNSEGWGSPVCASGVFDYGWELQFFKLFDVIAM